jgi:AcrR family transcriptional regulator
MKAAGSGTATPSAQRPYRMRARARAAAATRERILDAAIAVFWERPVTDIPLDEVARRAGVTVQTVIRRFGGKDDLLAAAVEREVERIARQRDRGEAGDLRGAVRVLLDHYEEVGDGVLHVLAAEEAVPGLRRITTLGRAYHESWCERVFAPALASWNGATKRRRLAQLIAVTDVLTWKLLRRDRGLSRRQTELALRELLAPLTGGT